MFARCWGRGAHRVYRTGSGSSAGVALALLLLVSSSACDVLSTETPGALVPPTADADPALPQLRVDIAERERALHLRRFGDPNDPTMLVLPGGPGADFRLLLPLQALVDRYHVVMWDPRGAGLSERVTRDELTLDSFVREIAAVRAVIDPGRPVTLVGHSHGAGLFLRYAIEHPGAVEQLVLIEPGPLTPEAHRRYRGGAVSWGDGQDFFWQNELISSRDHAAADFKAVSLLPLASRSFTCSGEPPGEYPMWRFGAFHYHVVTHGEHAPGRDFDWVDGVDDLVDTIDSEILVVAGTCGAAGADFQQEHHLEVLPGARLVIVPGAGHLSLFTTHAAETLQALRNHLVAYR